MNPRLIVRSLLKDWRFSLFVVLILGAGIALNTATFTIADGVLFDPLEVREPERLARVYVAAPWGDSQWTQISYPEYRELRDEARSFRDVAAFAGDLSLDVAIGDGDPFRATGTLATDNFFRTVGVSAQRGRLFDSNDHAAAVISDDFWRSRFDASDAAIGSTIRINRTPFTITGIAPPRFHGVVIDTPTDVWIPAAAWQTVMPSFERLLDDRETMWISAVGRLREGVDLRTADAEVRTIMARNALATNRKDPKAQLYGAIERAIDQDHRPQLGRLTTLFGLFVAIILVIACVNAGSLQLVRGERRQRELAIRAAVGASRGALLRQLFIEGVVLAAAAGLLGLVLAHVLMRATLALAAGSFPLLLHAARPVLDARVMLVLFALTTIGSLACGLVPALRATRLDVLGSIRGDHLRGGSAAIRGLLVTLQIALSVVVLVGAGLILRSLRNMQQVPLGFETERAAVASLQLGRQGYDAARATDFFDRLQSVLASTPGVNGVAIGKTMPIDAGGMLTSVSVPGFVTADGEDPRSPLNSVGPGFFSALGIPLLEGREFTAQDVKGGEPVAIVNDTFARHFWKTDDVVDRRFSIRETQVRVVGVVKTTRYLDLRQEPFPIVFQPRAQLPVTSAEVAVRSRGGSEAAAAILRDAVRSLDPNVPLHDLGSLRDRAGVAWQREEAIASMLTLFGALALVLASVGLFSVIAYRTETRRKEIGVRIAIGATESDIVRLVLRHTGVLLFSGLAAGLVAALFAGRLASSFLFEVKPFDAITFAAVSVVFLAIGLTAAALPARGAVRTDAAAVLRGE
jgi:predicted permease